jgi:Ni/Fe-hydrogenase subunit HybB-like protein
MTAMQANMRKTKSTFPLGSIILGVLVLIGAYATVIRYSQGLGAATNLSDARPWGLWISFDVMCGVALAAGGFTLAGIVYIFNIKRFYPLVRPTILTAYLGYWLAAGSILYDIGQPLRFWHPFISTNYHSVMLEIAWCVLLYLTILTLENLPMFFEKFNMEGPLKLMKMITIPVVITGIVLSTMHQSSLGALLLLTPYRLDALWYTPIIQVHFFVSAITVGLAMVIFESMLSAKAFGRPVEMHLLSEIGSYIPFVGGFYLLTKLADLAIAGEIGLMFSGPNSALFLAEIALLVVPMVLLALPGIRNNQASLFWSSVLVILAIVLNRFNVSFLGLVGAYYMPSWQEWAVTIGLTSLAVLIYMFTVNNFPVLDQEPH